jgi:hypothetical protein
MTDEEHVRALHKRFLALEEAISAARQAGLTVECSFDASALPRITARREILNMTASDAYLAAWLDELAKENPDEKWLQDGATTDFIGSQTVRNFNS